MTIPRKGYWPRTRNSVAGRRPTPATLRRFGIAQGSKVRAIDDGKDSGTNDVTRVYETIALPAYTWIAGVAQSAHDNGYRGTITSGTDDVEAAYRKVPTKQPEATIICYYDPATDAAVFRWKGPRLWMSKHHKQTFSLVTMVKLRKRAARAPARDTQRLFNEEQKAEMSPYQERRRKLRRRELAIASNPRRQPNTRMLDGRAGASCSAWTRTTTTVIRR